MRRKRDVLTMALVGVLCLLPLALPEYWISLLNYVGLSSIVVLGLILLTGIGGMTSFGQAAFVGVGAYSTAYLTTGYGISPWITLLIGAGLTVVLAFIIGIITLSLSGHYLPLSTIAWGLSLYYLFGNLEILGGHTGMGDLPPISVAGVMLESHGRYYFLIWSSVAVCGLLIANLLNSRVGRAIRSLNGATIMAESLGVNTRSLKIQVFVLSALLASISGWLYAHLLRFVSSTPFNLGEGIQYLFMVVIGGSSFVFGAIAGSAILVALRELLQGILPRLLGAAGNYELIVFGLMMITLLQQTRLGIMNLVYRFIPRSNHIARFERAYTPLPRRAMPDRGSVILSVHGISKRFGGLTAVNQVNVEQRAGEILGLIGPNGAGKSTTFGLISGTLRLSSGSISLMGKDITKLRSRAIASLGMARTFQHVRLLPSRTVLENVMIGAHLRGRSGFFSGALRLNRREESAIYAEAMYQIERVGLGDVACVPAGDLALGKQRLVEVARAMCADPLLLLADEPAAGLRHLEKVALANLFDDLRRDGISILLVEHDMEFVMNLADRLVVLNFGECIAEGSPAEISANQRVLEAYLGGCVGH